MAKIESLSAEQASRLTEYREAGIRAGLCCDPVDRASAKIYAEKLQAFLKRPWGPTIIMPGLLHTWYGAVMLGGAQVWESVWASVRASVGASVGESVWASVGDQVKNFVWPYLDGHWWASWWAWRSYMTDVLGVRVDNPNEWILSDQRHFGPIYPLANGATIICERPLCIHRSGPVLHYDGGPAVAYGDGTRVWALHGVRVPQELAEMQAEKLDCAQWIGHENAEVRREFVRKVGAERVMQKLGSNRLDKDGDYELHEIDLRGRTGKWPALKMLNPSIGVWHVEWVDKTCRTVAAALAWRNQSEAKPLSLT